MDGEDFYIDLLFYHLKLRCYVVIDLKVTGFKPEYTGKMNFYLSAVDDLFRRSAFYAGKILKGAKPADIPVEQPTKFEFVINLKTAKQIGLTIPPEVLARANRLIK